MPTAIRFITRIQDADDFADLDAVQFVSMAASGFVTNERVLTGTANQVIVTDGGAGGNATLSTPQDIHTGATPQFTGLGIGVAGVAGRVGIGIAPAVPLHILDAAGESIRVSFNAATYSSMYTDVGGYLHLTSTGGHLVTPDVLHIGTSANTREIVGATSHVYARGAAGCVIYFGELIDTGNIFFRGGGVVSLAGTRTLAGNLADGYTCALICDPSYTGAFTVTRHNYIDVQDVGLAGGAAVTDAAVLRFDAAIGTHKALPAAFTTTDSNGDTTNWAGGILINVLGTLYKIPFIAA